MHREEELFLSAMVKPASERAAFLNQACADDEPLRKRIEALLASHEHGGRFLNEPPIEPGSFRLDEPALTLTDISPRLTEGPGTVVGRYKLLEQIGEGGFGAVYMAEQQEPVRRRVALKIIKLGMDTRQVIARFEAERQALAMMDHPNIAKVLDAGTTETGRPFFVMELVRGQPITTFCDQNQFTTEERLKLFADVCRAIQHAHQKGVIHRDVKPSNVLVMWHDDRPAPKVIDFGIAKATEHRLTEKTVFTRFAQMIGTPTYMSPEQAQLGLDVDTRSDIYSLGVLLYELLTGSPPFDSQQLLSAGYDEMRRRICEEEPLTPSRRLSSLSDLELSGVAKRRRAEPARLNRILRGELDWIVMKAVEKDRKRRYDTAATFAEDIQRYLDRQPIAAAPPSAAYRLRKLLARNKALVGTISAVAAALLVGTIVSTWQAIRATSQTKRAVSAEHDAVQAEQRAIVAAQRAADGERRAEESEQRVKRTLYVAEMAIAQREFDELNTMRTLELLTKHLPQPGEPDYRGFEWRWMWNQCHQELFQMPGHSKLMRDLRFSPDGKWFASASRDGTVRLWDFDRRQEVWQWSGGTNCNAIDFSPDGKLLAAIFSIPNNQDNRPNAFLWDVTDAAAPVEVGQFRAQGRLRFSPDGKTLSGGGKQYDLSGKIIRDFKQSGPSTGQSFSKDGATLVTIDLDGTGRIWDMPSGELLATLPKHQGYADAPAKGVAISPLDANVIVTAAAEGVRIWDRSGKLLRTLPGPVDTPLGIVEFSCDGRFLAAWQYSGAIWVFETKTWTEIAKWRVPVQGNVLAFSPIDESLLIAAGDDGIIRGWYVTSSESFLDHSEAISSLEFSPDGRLLAVGLKDGAVSFWDLNTHSKVFTTGATRKSYSGLQMFSPFSKDFVAFSPDGKILAVIGPENGISLWNLERHMKVQELAYSEKIEQASDSNADRRHSFWSLAFSREGDRLFAGLRGAGGRIVYWDWRNNADTIAGQLVHPSGFGVPSLTLSPDGATFVSGGVTNVKLWSTRELAPLRELGLPLHDDAGASSIDFTRDGSRLAVGDANIGAHIWDTSNWRQHPKLPHTAPVLHVAFSAEGDRLAVSDLFHTTKLWDVETHQVIATFEGAVCDFSPDGTILAVGCGGKSTRRGPLENRVQLYYAPSLDFIDRQRSASAALR